MNITNGSAAVSLMEAAGIAGVKLSWDDILHEGPVPAELSLAELSQVRADFLISEGYAEQQTVRQKFAMRDQSIADYQQFQKIILWFEHDLYDQLQLIQILDWFNHQQDFHTDLQSIVVGRHLCHHLPHEIAQLVELSRVISKSEMLLASQAWRTFTSDSPRDLNQLLISSMDALRFLKPALIRLSMEYPNSRNGLPLTEALILRCLQSGQTDPGSLFRAYTAMEDAAFMGDTTFWMRLNQMAFCEYPLIALQKIKPISMPIDREQKILITPYGQAALSAKVDWFSDNKLSKWIGGCLVSADNPWRYDASLQRLELKN